MKRIRRDEPADVVEVAPAAPAVAEPPQLQPLADSIAEVAGIAREAFDQMAAASRAITDKANEPAAKPPTIFRCTIAERDTRGRIKSIDIEVKG
jgi:hypothetical protein